MKISVFLMRKQGTPKNVKNAEKALCLTKETDIVLKLYQDAYLIQLDSARHVGLHFHLMEKLVQFMDVINTRFLVALNAYYQQFSKMENVLSPSARLTKLILFLAKIASLVMSILMASALDKIRNVLNIQILVLVQNALNSLSPLRVFVSSKIYIV